MSESEHQSPRLSSCKNLIKIKSKKKKRNLYDELTFVEDHVSTFYIGINENPRGADNPLTAKLADPDNMDKLAKDWVSSLINQDLDCIVLIWTSLDQLIIQT